MAERGDDEDYDYYEHTRTYLLEERQREAKERRSQVKERYSEAKEQKRKQFEEKFWRLPKEQRRHIFEERERKKEAAQRFGDVDVSVLERYMETLAKGKEQRKSLRLMIVGHYGAGKTTITRKLLGKELSGIQSTNGIDVHVHKCLAVDKRKWEKRKDQEQGVELMERFANVTIENPTHKPTEKRKLRMPFLSSKPVPTDPTEKVRFVESLPKSSDTDVKIFKSLVNKTRSTTNQTQTINIWDFGGQLVFYATHQLFHSPDAIYILVIDMSKGLDELVADDDLSEITSTKTVKSFCKFWMQSIHSFVGTSCGKPPVILVGTHVDMLTADKILRQKIACKYFSQVRGLFSEEATLKHLEQEDFIVDSSTSKSDLKRLREYIVSIADTGMHEIPAKWIPLESSLMKRFSQKHISFDEFCKLGSEHEMKDINELLMFLQYHHAQGFLIYFNEPGLSMCVVLNPQWIVDALKCIITCDRFRTHSHALFPLWQDLQKKAILHIELIDDVWQNNEEQGFMEHKEILIQYMTKFGIVAKAKQYDERNETCAELDFFVVPSLLRSHSTEADVKEITKRKNSTTSLVFSFENDSVSTTLYHRATAAALAMWSSIPCRDEYMLFEDVGVYRLDRRHAGIIEVTDQTIEIRVISLCDSEDVDCELSDKLRRFLEMMLKHEFGRFQAREVQYEIGIRCAVESRGSKHVTQIDDLKGITDQHVPCPELDHELDVQKIMTEWYPSAQSILRCYSTDHLRRTPTERDLVKIARAVGQDWQFLAHALNISQVECERIMSDYSNRCVLQIFHMLLTWQKEHADEATFEVLIKAMKENSKLTIDWDQIKNILDDFTW